MKKILTLALTVVLMLSMLVVDAGAYAVDLIYEVDSETKKETEEVDYEATLEQYLTLEFATAEDKLATMTMMYEKDGYQLWVDELTGEVATKCLASGQILFSNPYDVGAEYKKSGTGPSASTKEHLLSQIMISYSDNGTEKKMYSFIDAAMRGQITIKNIKNGIRVEYSIGREETRMLVPKLILKESFETKILDVFAEEVNSISREQADDGLIEINWRDYAYPIALRSKATIDSGNALWFNFYQLLAYYQLKSNDECATDREKYSMWAAYPITKTKDVYVFDTGATQTETIKVENYIKTYCPSYTYEELEKDHADTEYEGSDKNPALFKLSLEYGLDEWGMTVRLPANGLRFNESLYQLTYLSVLPYMGAGANYLLGDTTETFTGYNFFPDGSGTIFRHEDLAGTSTTTINAKVYGFDYAYNEITGNHTETVRYPVYGIVSNYHDIRTTTEQQLVEEAVLDPVTGDVISEAVYEDVEVEYTYNEDRGFVAIIEEGDALAELSTSHEGALSKYNSVNMLFYPRPKDSYNLANAISVGANATWTVVSSRKYVGNYKIRYIMLTDGTIAEENNIEDYYEVSWMGMAEAYRDYLYYTGDLSALTEEDVEEDIPLYIETFGTTETVEKILSVPVDVMTPLTSFDNVKTMYDELSAQGVSNIKFKLTGYANDGLFASVPYNLKWEKAVGGADGYEDLLDYAEENNFEVFPDFDFAYVRASTNTLFDGLTLKQHIVKSINNTYMSKRYYSATKQTMIGRYELAISAAYYSHFYEKLTANLLKYYSDGQTTTISIASLGNALNSDFDEDEPYNREDSKKSTVKALAAISDSFDDVMTESANAYSWKYVDYILNVPLDSSRYTKSSNSVPFIGVVLHGSKQFSGSALNMEGNIGYSLLKAIENGSGLYFIMCYQNYAVLKDSEVLSQYYSVRYDILKDDVVKYYNIVNDLTKDLQLSLITSHEFLTGERVPDADEIEADAKEVADKLAEEIEAAEALAAKEKQEALLNGRVTAQSNCETLFETLKSSCQDAIAYEGGSVTVDETTGKVTVTTGMQTLVNTVLSATEKKNAGDEVAAEKLAEKNYRNAVLAAIKEVYTTYTATMTTGKMETYSALLTTLKKNQETLAKTQTQIDQKLETLEKNLADAINEGIATIPTLLANYKAAEGTGSSAEALAELEKYAVSLANAEKYVELSAKKTELENKLNNFADSYTDNADFAVLSTALAEAEKAYETAKAADAATLEKYTKINNGETAGYTAAEIKAAAEYAEAAEKLAKAQTALEDRLNVLDNIITNCNNNLATIESSANEYSQVIELLSSATAELADINDNNKTTKYESDIEAAQNEVDALLPVTGNARKAYAAAQAKVDAYIDDFKSNYATSTDYKNAEADCKQVTADYDALIDILSANAPAKKTLDAYKAAADEKNTALIDKYAAELSYYSTAEYKQLKAAVDTAAAAVAVAKNAYNTSMTDSAKYKELYKTYTDAKAAYEAYTLAYKTEEDYLELEKTYNDLEAKSSALVSAYESTEEYKTLKAAAEKADAAYETAYKAISATVEGTATTKITDAQAKAFADAADAKGKADAALAAYVDEKVAEIVAGDEYKTVISDAKVASAAVASYISDFISDLDDEAKAALKEDNPEETKGGKYSAAKTAYTAAENYLKYFTGEKSVPSSVKDAVVYSKLLTEDAAYKTAYANKTAADSALNKFISDYSNQVKATKEADIAAITDATIKSMNAQYTAASAAYDAANTKVNEIGKELQTVAGTVYTAAYSYYQSVTTLVTNNNNVNAAQVAVDVSSLKSDYDTANASYQLIENIYSSANAIAEEAATAYANANAEAVILLKAQTDAIKAARVRVNNVKAAMQSVNSCVNSIRKNLEDSEFAVETICSDSSYSETLKNDLKASNKVVKSIADQTRAYSDKAIAAVSSAIDIAETIIATGIEVIDPYAETSTEEDETEEEEEDEGYQYTKYTDDSGNIVRVGYSNGVVFFLNYNYFAVTITYGEASYQLPAYGGVRVNTDGTTVVFETTVADAD